MQNVSSSEQNVLTIVYVSAATRPMSEDELEELLTQAREKNSRLGITGILLYHDGNFMQMLQGPQDAVRALYASIEVDPRHHMVIPLVVESGLPREFADWAMACGRLDAQEWKSLMSKLSPDGSALKDGSVASILRTFWTESGRP